MNVKGLSFSVVGLGRSGLAAARLLSRLGADVLVSDKCDDERTRKAAKGLMAEVVLGREVIRPKDIVVLSPGIPPSAPIFREALRLGSEVMGEVELFYRLWPGRIVAVTGTDGKSTVTTLVAHLLNAAKVPARAGGNLGNALSSLLEEGLQEDEVVVAEVSNAQLLTTSRFRPFVALVTNIAEDHIDFHGSFEAYVEAKAKVVANQLPSDYFVRNCDDPILATWLTPKNHIAPSRGQTVLEVSKKGPVSLGSYSDGNVLYIVSEKGVFPVCERKAFQPIGPHNTENALLALAACLPFTDDFEALGRGLSTYKPLPHRIEFVAEVEGVRFYNDSKATNPHATETALKAFEEPVVLIAGGFEKGLDLSRLRLAVAERCPWVILCGANALRLEANLRDVARVEVVHSYEEAVRRAFEVAKDLSVKVVLFSPASSSYDRFHGFEERGEFFKRVVLEVFG